MKRLMLASLLLISSAYCTARKIVEFSLTPLKGHDNLTEVLLSYGRKQYTRICPIVFASGNSVGIASSDTCALLNLLDLPKKFRKSLTKRFRPTTHYLIVSSSGQVFADLDPSTGAATGTPGHLLWEKDYIGTVYHQEANDKPSMPGSARRTDFCIGKCIQKKTTQLPK